MATSYGDYNPTDDGALANGAEFDAGVRAYKKAFNLTTDEDPAGGTANVLHIARLRAGSAHPSHFHINSSANLSGITFKIGTPDDDDKYATGVTGPNAATVVAHALAAAQALGPLTADTDIIATPSGNLAASGTIVFRTFASKR